MHRRHWSLRARLIALVLAVAALALVAVDVVIPLNIRAALLNGKAQVLTSAVANLKSMGSGRLQQQLSVLSSQTQLGGQVGWTVGYRSGMSKVVQRIPAMTDANPAVGWDTSTTQPVTVVDVDNRDMDYLALGFRTDVVPGGQGQVVPANIVAWVPLKDVEDTLQRLILLEILISFGLLVIVGGIAGVVIRRELRPLETMARTADEIAAGDLSRRVDPGVPGTEVGRLGTAFNGMVDGVSELLAERADSEMRMRQFVADASHELRTPVAAIRGYADLYRAGALPEQVAVERAMDRMGFESQRMGTLVEDLLTLTHTDSDAPIAQDRVDVVSLLTGVVDDAAVIDPTRTWRLAGTAHRATVIGDRLRLHQLFANLLANVRTHTPEGTTATVSLGIEPGVVTVAVIDDGPGVDDESLPRLFDRFFRADKARSRERGGSGLGLSIAASIVRRHAGRIITSHTPGGGLTVTVMLPQAPPETPGGEPTVADATGGSATESARDAAAEEAGGARDEAADGAPDEAAGPSEPRVIPGSPPSAG